MSIKKSSENESAQSSQAAQGRETTQDLGASRGLDAEEAGTLHKIHRRVREAAETTFSAAETVQQLYIGYPVAAQIRNEDDEEPTTSLFVDRRDPLDDPAWTVGEEPKGS